jgi:RNA polymerase sigma factor (TIGR02999 family)
MAGTIGTPAPTMLTQSLMCSLPLDPLSPVPDRPYPNSGALTAHELLPIAYAELHRLAQHRMAQERPGHSLQATALVHEAFLRIAGDREDGWVNRAQFFVAAAEAMRRILIDHARARGRVVHGGAVKRVTLTGVDLAAADGIDEVLAVDEAFERLVQADPRAADVVRLRFYAGLSEAETAAALNLSERTVRREWAYARAWLFDVLQGPS